MTKRKNYSATEKVNLLREHFIDKVAVSEICEKYSINPSQFYSWQKLLFENAPSVFTKEGKRSKAYLDKQLERENAKLKAKISYKDEVIAEIVADNLELKKNLGEL
jgi:transposase